MWNLTGDEVSRVISAPAQTLQLGMVVLRDPKPEEIEEAKEKEKAGPSRWIKGVVPVLDAHDDPHP